MVREVCGKLVRMRYVFGTFELDTDRYLLRCAGEERHLEPLVFELLAYLVAHPDRVISKDELIEQIWSGAFISDSALKRAVREVRRALGDSGEQQTWVQTVYGRGYRFSGEIAEAEPSEAEGEVAGRRLRVVAAVGIVLLAVLAWAAWRVWRPGTDEIPPPIRSLAVLPLADLSADPGQRYLADGMTEALISDLGAIRGLKVISRTSVMQYEGTRKTVRQIAAELGVDAVVEGSVLRANDRVQVSARLIRASTQEQIWTQTYERGFGDAISLQRELARTITGAILMGSRPEESERPAAARSVRPAAYDAYLLGVYHLRQPLPESARKAIESFDAALEIEPDSAPALAGLADAYRELGTAFVVPPAEAFARSKAAALRALDLDPELAEAHASLGFTRAHGDWDWPGAEASFRRALELNDNYAFAHEAYGSFLVYMGRTDEGLAQLRAAVDVDPFGLWNQESLGTGLYYARRYDDSIQQFDRVAKMNPDLPNAHLFLALDYLAKSLPERAVTEAETAAELSGRHPLFLGFLADAYAQAGQRQQAMAILDELKALPEGIYLDPAVLGFVYAALGARQEAMTWIDRSFHEHSDGWLYAKVAPFLDPLRNEPRFQALLARMGFPD